MSLAPRERLEQFRGRVAMLAATNVAMGLGVVLIGPPAGDSEVVAVPDAAAPAVDEPSPAPVLVASVHPLLRTTTTAPSTPPPSGPARGRAAGVRRVESTGYCLDGVTASGLPVGPGTVAMNGVPLGSRWRIHDGPFAGATLEATDRIGHSTEFDIWFAECNDAMAYGRRTITVERVG